MLSSCSWREVPLQLKVSVVVLCPWNVRWQRGNATSNAEIPKVKFKSTKGP